MEPDRLFEISWEVCNKVGGINTVIKSKAGSMVDHYGERFTMIGPYIRDKAIVDLDEKPVPEKYLGLFKRMESKGLKCHYGVWAISAEPEVILIDFQSLKGSKNDLKARYWDHFRVDSLYSQWDFDEPMLFSTAAGMLVEEYQNEFSNEKTVAHCHEWMAGFALLYLRMVGSKTRTIFTTHATMLGRAIAGSGHPLYKMIDNINPEEWAYKLGVQDKFTAERACASSADVFTTVSEITGLEAEKLLGRKPDVLLFNGMELSGSPTIEETSTKHVKSREIIREFLAYYFFPYYTFDLDESLIYFITARYEFKNKGIDILVEALGRLNRKLSEEGSKKTIVCFFWIPMSSRGIKGDVVESKNFYNHIKNYIDWHSQSILKQITFQILCSKDNHLLADMESLFSPEFLKDIKRDIQRFRKSGNPQICTHNLYGSNELLESLMANGLDNSESNKVKVILYPAYLDGADGLLNMSYYNAIVGCHLGLFPSYYEPWGYTPVEAASLAVPAVTTDLSGFGRFMLQNRSGDNKGVFVLPRFGREHNEEVEGLFRIMYDYSRLDHVERVQNRLMAKQLSHLSEWKHFAKYYFIAHRLALEGIDNETT